METPQHHPTSGEFYTQEVARLLRSATWYMSVLAEYVPRLEEELRQARSRLQEAEHDLDMLRQSRLNNNQWEFYPLG